MVVGGFFVFDYPANLQTDIMDVYGIKEIKYNLLYSVMSFPGIIIPAFIYFFCNYLGNRKTLVLFVFLMFLGQCVMIWGPLAKNFWILVAGRAIFGVGL
jgi:predicted MFS family arabinose efflux permease